MPPLKAFQLFPRKKKYEQIGPCMRGVDICEITSLKLH